jgi:hypothetical protein
MDIMDNRFPGFVGSVYILNYGWMYSGLWQMIKLLLSEDAKSRISFPTVDEVLNIIDSEALLAGTVSDVSW